MPKNKKPMPMSALSPREHDVAKLVAEGHSNKVIAAKLHISEHTAKFHVCNFVVKMGAQTRVDAAVKYVLADVHAREVAQQKWFAEQQLRAVA
jgi:DNA-binding NarL/FixJ family response regulator